MNVEVMSKENPPSSTTPQSRALRLPIDAGHVMMFARALGERIDNPEEVANRDIPTTFPVVLAQFDPDYELRPRPDQPWFGSGAGSGMPRTTQSRVPAFMPNSTSSTIAASSRVRSSPPGDVRAAHGRRRARGAAS
jgi:hypothetical protein